MAAARCCSEFDAECHAGRRYRSILAGGSPVVRHSAAWCSAVYASSITYGSCRRLDTDLLSVAGDLLVVQCLSVIAARF